MQRLATFLAVFTLLSACSHHDADEKIGPARDHKLLDAGWSVLCRNRASLSNEIRKTVEAIVKVSPDHDCTAALNSAAPRSPTIAKLKQRDLSYRKRPEGSSFSRMFRWLSMNTLSNL